MDKYLRPISPPPRNPNPISRPPPPWRRMDLELNGRISTKHRHDDSQLLLDSYSEVKAFGLCDSNGAEYCPNYMDRMNSAMHHDIPYHSLREGVSGLEFDSKGFYLASVTKSGCLTVHDFETLYCKIYGPSPSLLQDGTNHMLHISTSQTLDAVRWNPTNQDEVACMSRQTNKVLIYDIGLYASDPVQVLEKNKLNFYQPSGGVHNGLSDITFASADKSRLFASGLDGTVYVWDTRLGKLPCLELATTSQNQLNSIQLDMEDRVVFGASNKGVIYFWDLRGGRETSVAFQRPNEAYHPPLTSLKVSSMLEKITSLKAQTTIMPSEIHSIQINPSCLYQLAFHLDNGWSGVINLNTLSVTHVHCPPPAWLEGVETPIVRTTLRRPTWLPTNSIFAVGSTSGKGIFLLDFLQHRHSACYVDYSMELQSDIDENKSGAKNKYVNLTEDVLACAAHPLNGTIVAGTKQSSLMVISQKDYTCKSDASHSHI